MANRKLTATKDSTFDAPRNVKVKSIKAISCSKSVTIQSDYLEDDKTHPKLESTEKYCPYLVILANASILETMTVDEWK